MVKVRLTRTTTRIILLLGKRFDVEANSYGLLGHFDAVSVAAAACAARHVPQAVIMGSMAGLYRFKSRGLSI